jgi:hypothetical protein
MPLPWSITRISTRRPAARARTVIADPAGEYFTALSSSAMSARVSEV